MCLIAADICSRYPSITVYTGFHSSVDEEQLPFLLHDATLALYMLSLCVCPSVCHTLVLYQNV